MACENNEQRRPENCGGRGSRCPQYRGSPPEIISSGAHGVSFFLDSPFNRTNILPRWGRGTVDSAFYKHAAPLGQGNGGTAFYKHAAPLGQGNGGLSVLQTCCPAGAGNRGAAFYLIYE